MRAAVRSLPARGRPLWHTRGLGRRLASALACAALVSPSLAHEAQAAPSPGKQMRGKGGNFGLGVSLGDPMPLSMKLFLHPNHALQWDGGWMPLHHGTGGITMSYLWHPMAFVSNDVMDFLFYVGIGIGFSGRGDGGHHGHNHGHRGGLFCMQVRVPALGLAFHWRKVPLDTALEGAWSPCMVEVTGGGHTRFSPAHGDVSAKVRYYF